MEHSARCNAKTVVITGASAGVGRATAFAFARLGANLALIARGAEALDEVAAQARGHGVKVLPLPLDVGDASAVEAAAHRVESELGAIDVWVNNAMLTVFSPLTRITPEEFERVTRVTYLGYVWGTMAALRHMTPRNHGTIVQVGSALAYRSIPLQSAYCGAKHAIHGFTDTLRSELLQEHSRIHLTMVQMPALNTPQFDWAKNHMPHAPQPVPPIYQPEVAARAIVWAATHHRREVYVGMSTIKAILANKLVPGWLDRYLGRTGYASQQRAAPADPAAPSNLWEPVQGAHRAHGAFDDKARDSSLTLWLDTHRPVFLLGVLALVSLAWRGRSRR